MLGRLLALAIAVGGDYVTIYEVHGEECIEAIVDEKDEQHIPSYVTDGMTRGKCSEQGYSTKSSTQSMHFPFVSSPVNFTHMRKTPLQEAALKALAFLSAPFWSLGGGMGSPAYPRPAVKRAAAATPDNGEATDKGHVANLGRREFLGFGTAVASAAMGGAQPAHAAKASEDSEYLRKASDAPEIIITPAQELRQLYTIQYTRIQSTLQRTEETLGLLDIAPKDKLEKFLGLDPIGKAALLKESADFKEILSQAQDPNLNCFLKLFDAFDKYVIAADTLIQAIGAYKQTYGAIVAADSQQLGTEQEKSLLYLQTAMGKLRKEQQTVERIMVTLDTKIQAFESLPLARAALV
jgi:hypothetical protein